MVESVSEIVKILFGVEHFSLDIIVMTFRGLIVYFSAILLVKINKKFFGIRTSSNFVLFVMLGSMFATAITADELFLPIVSTIFLLSLVNRGVTFLFFHYPQWEHFFVGAPVPLISHGEIQWANMRKNLITKNDLENALQTQLHTNDFSKIDSAYFAIDGTINFILKS